MEECNFPEDIVVEILCHLPKKSLTRFKCVCKHWRSLISDRNRVFPRVTDVGLVFQSLFIPEELGSHDLEASEDMEKNSSKLVFLHLDGKGNASREISDLCCDSGQSSIGQNHCLIGSCNGFLLFETELLSDDEEYLVYHPATKRSWHIIPPQNPKTIFIGLASDGPHFNLVRITHHSRNLESQVYSSHYQGWRELFPPSTVPTYGLTMATSKGRSVFVRGALHWIWMDFLLIFHLDNGNYKLVSLPRVPGNWTGQIRCIWESEGSLNYCNVACDRGIISIWSLHKGNWSSKRNKYSFRWKVKHKGILSPSLDKTHHPNTFRPFAFNDDFGIVYLVTSCHAVFSYNLATGEMKGACTSPFEGFDDRVCCLSFPFVSPSHCCLAFPFLYPTQFNTAVMEDGEPSNASSDKVLKRRKLL